MILVNSLKKFFDLKIEQRTPLVSVSGPAWWGLLLFIAAINYAGAQLGQLPGIGVGLVWPPIGLMLPAVLLFGYRVWPAIALGSLLANLQLLFGTGAILVVIGRTGADVLAVLLGAYVLHRFTGVSDPFRRVKDVLKFNLAALVSQALCAALGVFSFALEKNIAWSSLGPLWRGYWIADVVSVVLIVPFILIWYQKWGQRATPRRWIAHGLGYGLILAGCFTIFYFNTPILYSFFYYFTILSVIWAAFVLGRHGAITTSLIVALISIWYTTSGFGPFITDSSGESILALEIYLAAVSGTAMVLSAVLWERKEAEVALQDSQAKLQALFDTVDDFLVICAPDGRILETNPVVQRRLGYNVEELNQLDLLNMAPVFQKHPGYTLEELNQLATQSSEANALTSEALSERRTFRPAPLIARDGSFIPIETRITQGKWGERAVLFGISRDITLRQQAEDTLKRQLAFDDLVTRLLARFAACASGEVDTSIQAALHEIAEFTGADHAFVILLADDRATWSTVFQWCARHVHSRIKEDQNIPVGMLAWSAAKIMAGEAVVIHCLDDYPPEAAADRQFTAVHGAKSALNVPMRGRIERISGSIGLYSHARELIWNDNDRVQLQLVGDAIATLLERKRAEEALALESALNASMAELSQALLVAGSVQEITQLTLEKAQALTGSKAGYVGYIDPNTGYMVVPTLGRNARPRSQVGDKRLMFKQFTGLWGWSLHNKASVFSNHPDQDERATKTPPGHLPIERFLAVPGLHGETLVGQITLANPDRDYTPRDLLVIERLASIFALGVRHRQAEDGREQQIKRLHALRTVDQAIISNLDLDLTLNLFVEEAVNLLQVDAVSVLLLNQNTYLLEFTAGRGFHTEMLRRIPVSVGKGHAGRAALERRTVHIDDLVKEPDMNPRQVILAKEEFVAYYGVPLIVKSRVLGVLEVYSRSPLDPNWEWLNFLDTLAGQATITIDNASMVNSLHRSKIELELAYDRTLEGWSRALDLRDKETEGHTRRVAEMTVKLAAALGLSEEEVIQARRGALLHDIGKISVPDAILLKQGELTEEEWVIMRKHPQYAYELLSPIEYLRPALDIPYCHHERWNGSGYPRGLAGEQIPLKARIFSVVDEWDALTSDRAYRKAWNRTKVMKRIISLSGVYFDPRVVEQFMNLVWKRWRDV